MQRGLLRRSNTLRYEKFRQRPASALYLTAICAAVTWIRRLGRLRQDSAILLPSVLSARPADVKMRRATQRPNCARPDAGLAGREIAIA
jgi:hypothetical protein